MRTLMFIFLMGIIGPIYSQVDVDGFRNYKLGTPFSEMSEGMVKSSSINPGYKGYEKQNDDMSFEGITAHTIIYMFRKDLLHVVSIGIYNKDVDNAAAALTKKYGDPVITETPFVKSFEWDFISSKVVLSLFPTNPDEKSAAIGIRRK